MIAVFVTVLVQGAALGYLAKAPLAKPSDQPATSSPKSPEPAVTRAFARLFVRAPQLDFVRLRNELALRLPGVAIAPWSSESIALTRDNLGGSLWVEVHLQADRGDILLITGDGRIFRRQQSVRVDALEQDFARDLTSLLLSIEERTLVPTATTPDVAKALQEPANVPTSAELAEHRAFPLTDRPAGFHPSWRFSLGLQTRVNLSGHADDHRWHGLGPALQVSYAGERWLVGVAASLLYRRRPEFTTWRERLGIYGGRQGQRSSLRWRTALGPVVEWWQLRREGSAKRPTHVRLGDAPQWLIGLGAQADLAWPLSQTGHFIPIAGIRGEIAALATWDHGWRQVEVVEDQGAGQSNHLLRLGGVDIGLAVFLGLEKSRRR